MNIFKRLYDYREMLKTSIKKDIGGKIQKLIFRSTLVICKSTTSNYSLCDNIPTYNEK